MTQTSARGVIQHHREDEVTFTAILGRGGADFAKIDGYAARSGGYATTR